jgi:ADP-ribose pyrophosphatase YjhB (NUDIX family)
MDTTNSDIDIDRFYSSAPNTFHNGLSIDCVIFGFDDNQLKVLLLKWKNVNLWSLPGGFIRKEENLDNAAGRILNERTGLHDLFLQQFYTFGDLNRRNPEQLKDLGKYLPQSAFKDWLMERFISTGYFSLVMIEETTTTPDALSDKCEWVNLHDLPELIFDHKLIINKALEKLRIEINYLPLGLSLLPKKFTMGQLQKLYEAILDTKLNRANFQKKILKMGFLDRGEKLKSGGAHKAPYLYEFNKDSYNKLLESGTSFI